MRSPQKTSNRGFHPMCQAHTCATRTHSFSPWRLNPPVAAWYSFHHVPPHILTMSEPRPPVSCGGLRKHTLRWRLHEALRPVFATRAAHAIVKKRRRLLAGPVCSGNRVSVYVWSDFAFRTRDGRTPQTPGEPHETAKARALGRSTSAQQCSRPRFQHQWLAKA